MWERQRPTLAQQPAHQRPGQRHRQQAAQQLACPKEATAPLRRDHLRDHILKRQRAGAAADVKDHIAEDDQPQAQIGRDRGGREDHDRQHQPDAQPDDRGAAIQRQLVGHGLEPPADQQLRQQEAAHLESRQQPHQRQRAAQLAHQQRQHQVGAGQRVAQPKQHAVGHAQAVVAPHHGRRQSRRFQRLRWRNRGGILRSGGVWRGHGSPGGEAALPRQSGIVDSRAIIPSLPPTPALPVDLIQHNRDGAGDV